MIIWICNHNGCNREVSGLFGMPRGRDGWCHWHQDEAIEQENREKQHEQKLARAKEGEKR